MTKRDGDDDILGFWLLESWDEYREDGSWQPFGGDPLSGFLVYAADGTMSVSIYRRDQPVLLTTYAGHYTRHGREVVHYPVAGNSPSGTQAPKHRYLTLRGNTMIMDTAVKSGAPQPGDFTLLWRRWLDCYKPAPKSPQSVCDDGIVEQSRHAQSIDLASCHLAVEETLFTQEEPR